MSDENAAITRFEIAVSESKMANDCDGDGVLTMVVTLLTALMVGGMLEETPGCVVMLSDQPPAKLPTSPGPSSRM